MKRVATLFGLMALSAMLGCASLLRDEAQAERLEAQWKRMDKNDPQVLLWLRTHSEWDMVDYDAKRAEVQQALVGQVDQLRRQLKLQAYSPKHYQKLVEPNHLLLDVVLEEAKTTPLPPETITFCQAPYEGMEETVKQALKASLGQTVKQVREAKTIQALEAAVKPQASFLREIKGEQSTQSIDGVPVAFLAVLANGADEESAQNAILTADFLAPEIRVPLIDACTNYAVLSKIADNPNEVPAIRDNVRERLDDPQERLNLMLNAKDEKVAMQALSDSQEMDDEFLAYFILDAPKTWTKAKVQACKQLVMRSDNLDLSEGAPLKRIIEEEDLSWWSAPLKSTVTAKLKASDEIERTRFLDNCQDIALTYEMMHRLGGERELGEAYDRALARVWLAYERGSFKPANAEWLREEILFEILFRLNKGYYRSQAVKEQILRDSKEMSLLRAALDGVDEVWEILLPLPQERRRFLLGLITKENPSAGLDVSKKLINADPETVQDVEAVLTPEICATKEVQQKLRSEITRDGSTEWHVWVFDRLFSAKAPSEFDEEEIELLLSLEAESVPDVLHERVASTLGQVRATAKDRIPPPEEGTLVFDGFYIGMPAIEASLIAPPGVTFGSADNRITAIIWDAAARLKAFNEWEDDTFVERFPSAYGLPEFSYKEYDQEALEKVERLESPMGQTYMGGLADNMFIQMGIREAREKALKPFYLIRSRKHNLEIRLLDNGTLRVMVLDDK